MRMRIGLEQRRRNWMDYLERWKTILILQLVLIRLIDFLLFRNKVKRVINSSYRMKGPKYWIVLEGISRKEVLSI